MTAKEFREKQRYSFDHFTKLTQTGISPNYDNIELFAEEYANQQLQLGGVSNQRELLLAYEMWFRLVKFSNIMDLTTEQIIDKFLSQQ